MNHITLYRKYRPKDFSEVAGEVEIITTIKNSLKNNRMAHAYLFTGPRGVGKTTTARLIAKGLNCITNGTTDNPCNTCENCLAVDKGNFIDLIEIDAASNRGIDEIRSLKDKINYQPVKGRKKVYIIDEVHMLTKEAFNALLKTLEEPPSHVLFILATTEPDKILDTIISRCQRYDFLPMSLDEMGKKLDEIAASEGIKIEKDSYKLIHEKAGGSMRDAISILEKIISYYLGEDIDKEKVEKALGVIPRAKLEELYSLIVKNDLKEAMVLLDKLWENGIDVEEFFRDFAYYLKELIMEDNNSLGIGRTVGIIEEIFEVINRFKYEEDKRLLGYLILYKISPKNINKEKEIVYIEKEVSSPKVEVVEKIVEKIVEVPSGSVEVTKEVEKDINLDLNMIKSQWSEILRQVGNRKITLRAFLDRAIVSRVEGNTLVIAFSSEAKFHKEMMEKKEYGQVLEDVLKSSINNNIKVAYEVVGEIRKEEKSKGKGPLVEKVLDFFEGEIVE